MEEEEEEEKERPGRVRLSRRRELCTEYLNLSCDIIVHYIKV